MTTDVPGCDAADLDIQATDNQLTIRAEPADQEVEEGRSVQQERAPPAERVVQLPGAVEADEAVATCENGVCRVELPKSEEARQREIAFQ
ncbi:Hsp20/alpha crystallin family protein [Salinirubellus sp. GCM10025818]|uniref:Hsp20/alpha crystallin family protein n=1 Tax=Salinirubellus TaxID=2162630 RepID=UPI0036224A3C